MVNQSGTCRLVGMDLMFQYVINSLLCLRRSYQQHLFIFFEFANPAFDVGRTVVNCSILNTGHVSTGRRLPIRQPALPGYPNFRITRIILTLILSQLLEYIF